MTTAITTGSSPYFLQDDRYLFLSSVTRSDTLKETVTIEGGLDVMLFPPVGSGLGLGKEENGRAPENRPE